MLERFLRFGAVAAGATLAISLSEYFVGNHVDRTLSWILAVTISAIAAHSVDFLLITVPMQFSTLRRILNAMFTIEGYWYESVNSPDHPHTYACIEYDPKEKSFRYTGHNFTSQYELNASFSSESFEVRRHAKQPVRVECSAVETTLPFIVKSISFYFGVFLVVEKLFEIIHKDE